MRGVAERIRHGAWRRNRGKLLGLRCLLLVGEGEFIEDRAPVRLELLASMRTVGSETEFVLEQWRRPWGQPRLFIRVGWVRPDHFTQEFLLFNYRVHFRKNELIYRNLDIPPNRLALIQNLSLGYYAFRRRRFLAAQHPVYYRTARRLGGEIVVIFIDRRPSSHYVLLNI